MIKSMLREVHRKPCVLNMDIQFVKIRHATNSPTVRESYISAKNSAHVAKLPKTFLWK